MVKFQAVKEIPLFFIPCHGPGSRISPRMGRCMQKCGPRRIQEHQKMARHSNKIFISWPSHVEPCVI